MMLYFYFLKYAVSRYKTLVWYPKWCAESDSEVRFRLTPIIYNVKVWFFFGHFRLPDVIETSTKPQFQPSSTPWKNVWVNILPGAAVIERPDLDQWKKLVIVNNTFLAIAYKRLTIKLGSSKITSQTLCWRHGLREKNFHSKMLKIKISWIVYYLRFSISH